MLLHCADSTTSTLEAVLNTHDDAFEYVMCINNSVFDWIRYRVITDNYSMTSTFEAVLNQKLNVYASTRANKKVMRPSYSPPSYTPYNTLQHTATHCNTLQQASW